MPLIRTIYIVKLEEGVWLALGKGCPARTLNRGCSKGFWLFGNNRGMTINQNRDR